MSSTECLISLNNLSHNFQVIRRAANDLPIFAVIKANAYGLGAVKIAQYLEKKYTIKELPVFCVARKSELQELRAHGIKRNILILSEEHNKALYESLGQSDHLSFCTERDFEIFLKETNGRPVQAHLDFNTGMNRLGLSECLLDENGIQGFIRTLEKCRARGLIVTGIMSHLACAEMNPEVFSSLQLSRFIKIVNLLKSSWTKKLGDFPLWIHLNNSEGVSHHISHQTLSAVRPGLHLWGLRESQELKKTPYDLKPVATVRSKIRQIRKLQPGEGLGYGLGYRCTENKTVATVSMGYADGLPRLSSAKNLGLVVQGKKVNFLGRISMDLCAVDLSSVTLVNEGDWAYWVCAEQSYEELASSLGTISYELQCSLSSRVERLYKEGVSEDVR